MKIIGINGSLRQGSLNRHLLRIAGDAFSEQVDFTIVELGNIPLYNGDLDGDNKPAPVVSLKQLVDDADGLLIATPEYNYSIPGVLKNALDWVSRPAYKSPLAGKRCGILSASMSPIGGVRAQAHLRAVLAGTLSPVYPAPELSIGSAHEAFNDQGQLVDSSARRHIDTYVAGFEQWLNNT